MCSSDLPPDEELIPERGRVPALQRVRERIEVVLGQQLPGPQHEPTAVGTGRGRRELVEVRQRFLVEGEGASVPNRETGEALGQGVEVVHPGPMEIPIDAATLVALRNVADALLVLPPARHQNLPARVMLVGPTPTTTGLLVAQRVVSIGMGTSQASTPIVANDRFTISRRLKRW